MYVMSDRTDEERQRRDDQIRETIMQKLVETGEKDRYNIVAAIQMKLSFCSFIYFQTKRISARAPYRKRLER